MDTSRYQLVDSLYGPGTVGAWLLSLCAVLLSWTLDTSSRSKDTISVDFIAILLLPLIAAGHTLLQITQLSVPVAEVITAKNVELQKYASALEAPLNICETFSVAALLLAPCCGPWWGCDPNWKRLGLVLTVGLLSWGTENVMFGMGTMKGVHVTDATLSRPYLFFLTPIVASTWAFLALCLVVGVIVWAISVGNIRTAAITHRRDLERRRLRQPRNRSLHESEPKPIDNTRLITRKSIMEHDNGTRTAGTSTPGTYVEESPNDVICFNTLPTTFADCLVCWTRDCRDEGVEYISKTALPHTKVERIFEQS